MKPIDQSDLQSYCRTCLEKFKSTRAARYNIHDTPTLLKNLLVFTGLNVDDDRDSLYPQALCRSCFDTVQNFERFRTKAMETEKRLGEIVATVANEKSDLVDSDSMDTREDSSTEQIDSDPMVTIHDTNISQNTREDLAEENTITADSIKVEEIEIEDVSYDDSTQDSSIEDMDNSNINAVDVKVTVGDSSDLDYLNISTRRKSKRISLNTAKNKDIQNKTIEKVENITKELPGVSNPFELGLNSLIQQETEQLENNGCGYKCTYCSREFVYRKQFNKHIQRHESREFYCKVCGVARLNKSELTTHMRVHDENAPRFQCEQCPMSLITQQSLERHVRVVHEGIRDFVCDLCPRRFSSKTHQNKHAEVHVTKPFHCEICYRRFATESGLKTHLRDFHKKKESKLICKYCQKHFTKETYLREHEYAHEHPDGSKMVHTCRICDKKLRAKWLLTLHMRIHNVDEVKSTCPICSKVFPHSFNLRHHISQVHEKKLTFKCLICSSLFSSKKNLRLHELTHFGKTPFSCEHCGKAFITKSNLKTHKQGHERPIFNCKLCALHFRSEETLKRHVSVHKDLRPSDLIKKPKYIRKAVKTVETNDEGLIEEIELESKEDNSLHSTDEIHNGQENKLICKYCSECLMTETLLREHEYAHENPDESEKEYNCEICNKKLRPKWRLTLHMRTHSEEEVENSCPICLKVFPRGVRVSHHIRMVHQKESKFKCNICSELFKSKKVLVLHELSHIGKKPFFCEHCGQGFLNRSRLKLHIRSHIRKKIKCNLCTLSFLTVESLQKHALRHKGLRLNKKKKVKTKYTRKTNSPVYQDETDEESLEENSSRNSSPSREIPVRRSERRKPNISDLNSQIE